MSIFEKAKELGQEIKKSPEYEEVMKCSQQLQENADALSIIQDFQKIQQQLQFAQSAGIVPEEQEMEEFNNAKERIEANIMIMAYFKSQEDYGKMMEEVNKTISDQINDQ